MASRLQKADVFALSNWKWQAFVSLSWRDKRRGVLPGVFIRERVFFAWVRRIGKHCRCGRQGVAYLWARRDEKGDRTGREHLHGLIGDLPQWFITDFVLRPRPAVAAWWEQLGGGNVRTSPVYSASEVVEYFTKEGVGAREYELTKFGGACAVMLSHHAQFRLAEAVARNGSGHQLGTRNNCGKNWQEQTVGLGVPGVHHG